MITYKELKKNIKRIETEQGLRDISFALLGDTATQFLATAIKGYGVEIGYRADVYESEYDVIESEILDRNSELYARDRDIVIIYMSTEKAYDTFIRLPMEDRADFAGDYIEKISRLWSEISGGLKAKIIQFDFNKIDSGIYGNYGIRASVSWEYQYNKLQYLLSQEAEKNPGVFILGLDAIQTELGRHVFCDMRFYYDARMSISTEALPLVAKGIYDITLAAKGRVNKCLVLDLDNTLWGGVIGDDGLQGIELGELGNGRIYCDIQRWCLELKKRGVLLAVCSKNEEDTAKEPFEKHPDMVLKLSDIAMFVANWEDKASNIRYIQETLDIGMDSMVFLDDNPVERDMVRSLVPYIAIPELPEEPAEWMEYLNGLNLFETSSVSGGADRTVQYQQEASRRRAKEGYGDVKEYLKSLDMTAESKPFDEFHYPRIAELSQRSNQFNLRTIRYTEDKIAEIATSDDNITRYFTLRDKFGDYGLVSCVIMKKLSDNEAFIDTWFMSCRVLRRGMEEYIVNSVVKAAEEAGMDYIAGEYIPTTKNKMVEDIYPRMGFAADGQNRYRLKLTDFQDLTTYIS